MIKTAILLSAGLGERLRPLSLIQPKPLFEVMNKTMLQWWTEVLFSAGVKRLIINAHYQIPRMLECIEQLATSFSDRLEILPSPEEELLGTGGGIKNAAHLLGNNDFLVVNADIFSDFELVKLSLKHLANPGRLATLGLLDRQPTGNVSLGEDKRIIAFRQTLPVAGELSRQTYCGVMALSPKIFDFIPPSFSDIISVYIQALAQGEDIFGWTYDPAIWQDMGTIEDYWNLNQNLAAGRTIIHSTARVDGTLAGWNIIGSQAVIEAQATVENSVIWPGAVIAKNATIKNAVVTGQVPAGFTVSGGFFCEPDQG